MGEKWLEWTVWWETPASIVLAAGLLMIMWPAITTAFPNRNEAIAAIAVFTAVTFAFGVLFVDQMAKVLQ